MVTSRRGILLPRRRNLAGESIKNFRLLSTKPCILGNVIFESYPTKIFVTILLLSTASLRVGRWKSRSALLEEEVPKRSGGIAPPELEVMNLGCDVRRSVHSSFRLVCLFIINQFPFMGWPSNTSTTIQLLLQNATLISFV